MPPAHERRLGPDGPCNPRKMMARASTSSSPPALNGRAARSRSPPSPASRISTSPHRPSSAARPAPGPRGSSRRVCRSCLRGHVAAIVRRTAPSPPLATRDGRPRRPPGRRPAGFTSIELEVSAETDSAGAAPSSRRRSSAPKPLPRRDGLGIPVTVRAAVTVACEELRSRRETPCVNPWRWRRDDS
jgi:hypothetical protein